MLRCIDSKDRDFIYSQFSNETVNRYLYDAEPLLNLEEADKLISFYLKGEPKLQHRWIIVRISDNALMGTCGYHCHNIARSELDIGYDLQEQFWGKGYMTEALKGVLQYIKEDLNVKTVNAYTYEHNDKSIELLEKLGFFLTGYTDEIYRGKSYKHKAYTLVTY